MEQIGQKNSLLELETFLCYNLFAEQRCKSRAVQLNAELSAALSIYDLATLEYVFVSTCIITHIIRLMRMQAL